MLEEEMEDIYTPGFIGDKESSDYYLSAKRMHTFTNSQSSSQESSTSYKNPRLQRDITEF